MPAEIEFWRQRNAAFSTLYEQLQLPNVARFMAVLEAGSADTNLLASFKTQFGDLKKVGLAGKLYLTDGQEFCNLQLRNGIASAGAAVPVGTSWLQSCFSLTGRHSLTPSFTTRPDGSYFVRKPCTSMAFRRGQEQQVHTGQWVPWQPSVPQLAALCLW